MGAGISGWRLARAVSKQGHLGVVSGTALDAILARKLQLGDPGGHLRRAMAQFPDRSTVERVLKRYFVPGGKAPEAPFANIPVYSIRPPRRLVELAVLANFVEVFLAKEGHDGDVGINYLEKIQMPNPPSLYGALLAGVDYVLMGAGIPREIPGILDKLARHEPVALKLAVSGEAADDDFRIRFDPASLIPTPAGSLKRPLFVAIVSSTTLAMVMKKRATGKVDGFVIEGPTAGGHNAPPRGKLRLDGQGEPVYGKNDEVDLGKIRKLGLPFWLAGAHGRANGIADALAQGATGIQVGTPFAFCEESGLARDLKEKILERVRTGTAKVYTDPSASPTGFPFKIVCLEGTAWSPESYSERRRVCDLGYLRTAFRRTDGSVGYRCPAEPEDDFVRKGGSRDDCVGRRCLCNGLVANIGMGQIRADGYLEKPLVTSGSDLSVLEPFLRKIGTTYTAADVIQELCGDCLPTNRAP